ncbi:MAG TPA: DUF2628 domain-containing protein [Roseimicrobium sp.]|nr:DUF2628 domain-containing protein [Roseimicrobium sp.]
MAKPYEIFRHPLRQTVAVPAGFNGWAFIFGWIWALKRQLWLPAVILLGINAGLGVVANGVGRQHALLLGALQLLLHAVAGLKGGSWLAKSLELHGYNYIGAIEARDANDALAKVQISGGSIPDELRARVTLPIFALVPKSFQPIVGVILLTIKSAFRFRFFLALALLMLGAVVVLPIIIKDDGSARGLTQIVLTYTLGSVTALLGVATLWLSCGSLARDIEECQLQVVAVKPIPRWQIWLGKWCGIMALNLMLLTMSGVAVYLLIQWRAQKLTAAQQSVLYNEVLVGRKSAREPVPDYAKAVETLYQERKADPTIASLDPAFVRQQIGEMLKAREQAVPPGYLRRWTLPLGDSPENLKDQQFFMRLKFHAALVTMQTDYNVRFLIGPPGTSKVKKMDTRLSVDGFHEIAIPENAFDEKGVLTIEFVNPNDSALIFPLEDGMEVLYRESGFALNFVRGLSIILLWLCLLAAIGLAAASQLSFPVAAFFSVGLLVMALSSGTLATVVKEGGVAAFDHDGKPQPARAEDAVIVPTFKVLLVIVNMVQGFSPVDSLSSGRSVTWGQVGQAVFQIGFVLTGFVGVCGMVLLHRRELATAQGLH